MLSAEDGKTERHGAFHGKVEQLDHCLQLPVPGLKRQEKQTVV